MKKADLLIRCNVRENVGWDIEVVDANEEFLSENTGFGLIETIADALEGAIHPAIGEL